jgi:hypothetical protein
LDHEENNQEDEDEDEDEGDLLVVNEDDANDGINEMDELSVVDRETLMHNTRAVSYIKMPPSSSPRTRQA